MGRPIYSPSFEPYTTDKPSKKNNKVKVQPKVKIPPVKPTTPK